jgi:hypothetical protein
MIHSWCSSVIARQLSVQLQCQPHRLRNVQARVGSNHSCWSVGHEGHNELVRLGRQRCVGLWRVGEGARSLVYLDYTVR